MPGEPFQVFQTSGGIFTPYLNADSGIVMPAGNPGPNVFVTTTFTKSVNVQQGAGPTWVALDLTELYTGASSTVCQPYRCNLTFLTKSQPIINFAIVMNSATDSYGSIGDGSDFAGTSWAYGAFLEFRSFSELQRDASALYYDKPSVVFGYNTGAAGFSPQGPSLTRAYAQQFGFPFDQVSWTVTINNAAVPSEPTYYGMSLAVLSK